MAALFQAGGVCCDLDGTLLDAERKQFWTVLHGTRLLRAS
jgi:hydroxymethylpyrimidine pyrophosphatase-like HAD family hydrolase